MKEARIFKTVDEDGNEVVLEFRRPTQAVLNKSELVAKSKYSEALRKGVLVQKEVAKLLRERDLWTDKEEEVARQMREEMRKLEEKLQDPGLSNDEGMKVVEELRNKRATYEDHTSIFTSVADSTCESMMNEERNMFFAAECTYNQKTGQKVYKSLEDFKSRLNEQMTLDTYREAGIAGLETVLGKDLPTDLTSHHPENKWVSQRGLDKDSEQEEDEPTKEEAPKKKRGRPRKKASQ